MNILILAALSKELDPIQRYLTPACQNQKHVHLDFFKISIGFKEDRSFIVNYMAKNSIQLVINAGTAGALNDGLEIRDIIFPSKYINSRSSQLSAGELCLQFKNSLSQITSNWVRCSLYTAENAITSESEKRAVALKTGANAVDMEAFRIAEFCRELSVPFCSLKVISDTADSATVSIFNKKNLDSTIDKLKNELKILIDLVSDKTGIHEK